MTKLIRVEVQYVVKIAFWFTFNLYLPMYMHFYTQTPYISEILINSIFTFYCIGFLLYFAVLC